MDVYDKDACEAWDAGSVLYKEIPAPQRELSESFSCVDLCDVNGVQL